ncbi:MAG: HAD hydrolase-like protein [Patescibacteria group bacterium]
MKLIFDFDDTLFDMKNFKERIFAHLEKAGISRQVSEDTYANMRADNSPFSLKQFISSLLDLQAAETPGPDFLYNEILQESPAYLQTALCDVVKKAGSSNCYIVTNGDAQYQRDKIKKSGAEHLFSEIYVTPGSKKDIIAGICDRNRNDRIIFIDNKIEFIQDLDMKKCPNLQTFLYDGNNLSDFIKLIG